MTVIDVHTHMLTREYLDYLARHGGGKYEIKPTAAGQMSVHREGMACLTIMEQMFDYEWRIRDMDAAGVDVAIVSLTYPSVFFGDEVASSKAARMVNESMAEQRRMHPDRIQWFASIPWQYPAAALLELSHAVANGAIGVFVTASIDEESLTDAAFAPVWKQIESLGLPVLVHPGPPPGLRAMKLNEYGLVPSVGFMFDTTLAIARMILAGFLDRYPRLKIISAHGGGALPYLVGRLDRAHEMIPACAAVVKEKPSSYLQRIYYDSVVYAQSALELCVAVGTEDNVMYGSDYPHNLGDMKGCLARVDALSPGVARKIRGVNARRIFNL